MFHEMVAPLGKSNERVCVRSYKWAFCCVTCLDDGEMLFIHPAGEHIVSAAALRE